MVMDFVCVCLSAPLVQGGHTRKGQEVAVKARQSSEQFQSDNILLTSFQPLLGNCQSFEVGVRWWYCCRTRERWSTIVAILIPVITTSLSLTTLSSFYEIL